ncbi:MAG TPA: hypothetical protein VLT47_02525 [Anaeromyxobacteraceae bacterium]|nr:hypothetical protein [Anaeromyxobacteraceae bacterium]
MNIGQVLVGAGAAALPTVTAGVEVAGRLAAAAMGRSAPAGPAPKAGRALAAGGSAASGPRQITPTPAQRQAEQMGALLSRIARGALSGIGGTATSSSSSSAASGSLAFLKDPRLSVEEKLARLMVQLSDKYEKQLEQKLQQYADLESGKATSSSSTKKSASSGGSGGLLGGLTSLVSKAGLGKEALSGSSLTKLASQVAGPVLAGAATALGFPALAPLILKAGPLLGSVASGALTELAGGAKGKVSTSKASTSSSTASGASSTGGTSEKQLMTEIQILQEKQKEMFTLASNILRSMHDTKMAVIGNVR